MRKVVLWGHHVAEYQAMFDLTKENLSERILEFGCGTSAINASLKNQAKRIVSCDPLFRLDKTQLVEEVTLLFQQRVTQIQHNPTELNVDEYGGIDAFIEARRAGCDTFFADYETGLIENRYMSFASDALSFNNFSFDYALSSHYFFSLDKNQDKDQLVMQHMRHITELVRVASEVRIFPVMNRIGEASPLLGPVLLHLQQANYGVEVREVPYGLYPKGNAMLRVWAQACEL